MNAAIEFPPQTSIYAASFQRGNSAEAEILKQCVEHLLRDFKKSITLTGKNRDVVKGLYNDARVAGWDGYDAKPISFETYCRAEYFLKLLPNDLPGPDVSAHPDGEIVFEWRAPGRKILSISVGNGNVITFAGNFGATERYGVENFIDEIPSEIMGMFGKLFAE